MVSVVGKQWKLLEGFAQRPNLFIQLPMVDILTFQTRSRPIRIIRNSDPLSATHIGLRLLPKQLNGMMDRFSFPFVTTHFISESFVIRSRPIIVLLTKYSHARHSFIIRAYHCVVLVSWAESGFCHVTLSHHAL